MYLNFISISNAASADLKNANILVILRGKLVCKLALQTWSRMLHQSNSLLPAPILGHLFATVPKVRPTDVDLRRERDQT